ncbi:MAG TPA: DUF502 domain-containing protein [Vicinamibacterales bacterium]|nr:DUF502 domain-containing protein [Vicinamibacterales bacterium]
MLQWLRRSFIAGFFVTVPLVVSAVALIWVFRFADSLTGPIGARLFGRPWPGLGILATAAAILAIGALTTNVIGRRLLARSENLFQHVPLFRTIYAPVKQLISAFSPDNEFGFKRMVLVEDQGRGAVLGFLTKEFTLDRGRGAETLLAVYVPTNHLYLGDIVVCSPDRASFPDLTVEEGIRIFLTGGTGMPDRMRVTAGDNVN